MKVDHNTSLMQSLLDSRKSPKMSALTGTNQVRTRSRYPSWENLSTLLMLVLAVLILPAVGLVPSAASGIRMQNLNHTR